MNGALASRASRRAISVLPTPVGPIIRMFFGVISCAAARPPAAAPAVAQRDGDGALGVALADDVLVEFVDDLLRGHAGHGGLSQDWGSDGVRGSGAAGGVGARPQSSVSMVWLLVRVDADVAGDVSAFSTMSRASARCSRAAPAPRPARTARRSRWRPGRAPVRARRRCPVMISEQLWRSATSEHRLEPAQDAVGAPVLGQFDRRAHRCPWCFSSLASKRSNSVKASAVPPANPARMRSWCRRRTLRAVPFMTMWPRVTWPSPPRATRSPRRTDRMVVPWNCSGMSSRRRSRSGGSSMRITLSRCSRSSRNRNSPSSRARPRGPGAVAAITRTSTLIGDVAADAVELALRQHAQQARLQIGRHVADLVEEQRAAVGLLEAAAALRLPRR
jgi:hypothetical protein